VTAGDFNDDSNVDLAVARGGANNDVIILKGNGDGTFANQLSVAVGTGTHDIAVLDVDGNGRDDLVVTNSGDNNFTSIKFTNTSFAYAKANTTAGAGPSAIATGDIINSTAIDPNGNIDVAVTNATDGTVSIFRGNGDGTFALVRSLAMGASPSGVSVGILMRTGSWISRR